MTVLPLLLPLAGCLGGGGAGTAVGNPGDAQVAARALDPEVALDAVEIPIRALEGWTCDGAEVTRPVGRTLDAVDPEAPIRVPGGEYCALALALDGPLVAIGSTATQGTPFEVALAVELLEVGGRLVVDGQALLFDVPLALDADALDALGAVPLPPDDPLAVDWAGDAAEDAALWVDADGDGRLDPAVDQQLASFDPGPAAVGTQSASEAERDCGCDQRGGPGPALGFALALVASAARRRTRAQGGARARVSAVHLDVARSGR